MCRIGGRLRSGVARRRLVIVEIPSFACLESIPFRRGQCLVGSLTGVVASKRVTEASKGPLSTLGNRAQSAMAQGGLTERHTGRPGTKVEHSDPVVPHGRAI